MIDMKKAAQIILLCSSLAGCYVVPVQYPAPTHVVVAPAPSVAALPPLTARLYPTNDAAAALGRLAGTISRPERGHGVFSVSVGTEIYSGEATRAPNSTKGTANAASSLGGYMKCEYTMTTPVLGSGTCSFSNGARFDIHISG